MNETEFLESLGKVGIKVDNKFNIYGVGCSECVSYTKSDSGSIKWSAMVHGKMDGKDYEFKFRRCTSSC